jgi:ABC-2 type transport system permease protein
MTGASEIRLNRLWAVLRKESLQILRDRRTLALIILMPLIEMFLFAYAVDLTVDHLPTAVADVSLDEASRAFLDALSASGYFDLTLWVEDEAEVIRAIDEGRARAGVVVPPDFAAGVERGEAQALLIIDGSDSFTVQAGYRAATAIAQSLSMELLVEQLDRALGARTTDFVELPITTSTRVLYNPNLDDMIFIVPGIAAMILQILAVGQASMSVVREREMGTLEQILVTPIRPLELILGKMLPGIAVTLLDMLLLVSIAILWFGVPFKGSLPLFLLLSVLFIVSGLGLGLLISSVAESQKQAQQFGSVLMLLTMLLSGLMYPLASMPLVAQGVAHLIPATYFVRIARGIITKGVGLRFLKWDVLALVIYSVLTMTLAAVTFKKRLD